MLIIQVKPNLSSPKEGTALFVSEARIISLIILLQVNVALAYSIALANNLGLET